MKIVCISDTHETVKDLIIPEGDLLLHAGDFSFTGCFDSLRKVNAWFGELKSRFKYGIVAIPGNHELTMDKHHEAYNIYARDLITNARLLIDESVTIEGLKIYGSPTSPWFMNWAFNVSRGDQIRQHWMKIPTDVDILITHGPPMYMLDESHPNDIHSRHLGCWDLADLLGIHVDQQHKRLNPKLVVFGHIHGSGGASKYYDQTLYVNASCLNEAYSFDNHGVVVCSDCWNQPTCSVLYPIPPYDYCGDCRKPCCGFCKANNNVE